MTLAFIKIFALLLVSFQYGRNLITQSDGKLMSLYQRVDFRLLLQFYYHNDENIRLQADDEAKISLMEFEFFGPYSKHDSPIH